MFNFGAIKSGASVLPRPGAKARAGSDTDRSFRLSGGVFELSLQNLFEVDSNDEPLSHKILPAFLGDLKKH